MKKRKIFKGYPGAYKRNTATKLLWLFKTGIINYTQWIKANEKQRKAN